MNATIRRAGLGDERTLAELNAFVQDFHVISNPAYFKPSAHEEVTAWFQGLLEKSTVKIWIAEADGPVGYASALLHERGECILSLPAMARDRPDWSPPGLASQGHRSGARPGRPRCRKRGGNSEVELSSWVFNTGAHEAFRRLGFTAKVVRFGWSSVKQ